MQEIAPQFLPHQGHCTSQCKHSVRWISVLFGHTVFTEQKNPVCHAPVFSFFAPKKLPIQISEKFCFRYWKIAYFFIYNYDSIVLFKIISLTLWTHVCAFWLYLIVVAPLLTRHSGKRPHSRPLNSDNSQSKITQTKTQTMISENNTNRVKEQDPTLKNPRLQVDFDQLIDWLIGMLLFVSFYRPDSENPTRASESLNVNRIIREKKRKNSTHI